MHVTYELTPDDYWRFNLYYRRHKYPIRPFMLCALAGVLGLLFLAGSWVAVETWLTFGRAQGTLLLSLLILLLVTLLILPPTKGKVIRFARQRPGFFCEHSISISPEWLSEKTPVNESKVAWATLKSVEEDADYLFLFLDKLVAHTIPKRAFSSPHEAETFLNTARRYWEAAKLGQPVPAEDTATWPPPPRIGA
jgi:hypothetical protein